MMHLKIPDQAQIAAIAKQKDREDDTGQGQGKQ
jgi:hypothetical protein